MLKELKNENNYVTTENGAVAHKSTFNYNLDFFFMGSSLRTRTCDEKIKLFMKAFNEDKLLAMKNLFYLRDVRNGQGERETFRQIYNYIAKNTKEYNDVIFISYLATLFPEYGRWDDMYCLHETKLWEIALLKMHKQLLSDIASSSPSLLAKWLKSENASSKITKELARATRKGFGMSSKDYRKTISSLRKKISIIETKITNKNYDQIEYGKVPSQAAMKYKSAFYKNDTDRYTEYLNDLAAGKENINARTLTPSQIVKKILSQTITREEEILYNEMWNNLPQYGNENKENLLAVVDVSGSMYPDAINTAIGLGLYIAEHNVGEFHNHFLTFSSNPELVEVKGSDIVSKVKNMSDANWGMNTDLEETFNLILNAAIRNNIPQNEMPSRLIVISDMEFDECSDAHYRYDGVKKIDKPLMDSISEKFKRAGYDIPRLVFWNVESRQNNIPVIDTDVVQLVAGNNPVIFESILENKTLSATDLMLKVLNSNRYDNITKAYNDSH